MSGFTAKSEINTYNMYIQELEKIQTAEGISEATSFQIEDLFMIMRNPNNSPRVIALSDFIYWAQDLLDQANREIKRYEEMEQLVEFWEQNQPTKFKKLKPRKLYRRQIADYQS
jgi:hypothetical protein